MLFTFIVDTHKFAPHALDIDIPLDPAVIEKENIWLLGDIVDLKGCDPKDKEACLKYFEALCKAYGSRYLKGNHDGDNEDPFIVYLNDYACAAHGDSVCWSADKVTAFRNMLKFQGYGLIKRFINWARHLWKQRINSYECKRGVDICTLNKRTAIVYGHSHTTKILTKRVKGKVLINIPRGVTILDL